MRQVTGGRVVKTLAMTIVGLALVAPSAQLAAQGIPTEFMNLEVLPQDITRQEIVSLMRGYVGAVGGGRCSYCHMVSDQLDQPTDDFASVPAPTTSARHRSMAWPSSWVGNGQATPCASWNSMTNSTRTTCLR